MTPSNATSPFELFASRRFAPLFGAQIFGALNDNIFKNALIILIAYQGLTAFGLPNESLVIAAGLLFTLPFFLFSATIGQIADKYDRVMLMQRMKLAEIALMALGAAGFALQNAALMLFVLFALGAQSAFFGPLKNSLLPHYVSEKTLVAANGWLQSGTYLAILGGTLLGGLLALDHADPSKLTVTVIAFALVGWLSTFFMPAAPVGAPDIKINWNFLTETKRLLVRTAATSTAIRPLLGIAWFWLMGAAFLMLFPLYARDTLQAGAGAVIAFTLLFSIGIAVGSTLANVLLKGEISNRLAPWGALGISLGIADLLFASGHISSVAPNGFTDFEAFMATPAIWRIFADLLAISVFGGIFVVPLTALVQKRTDPALRARTFAASGILNAAGTVFAAALLWIGQGLALDPVGIFALIAVLNMGVAAYVAHRALKGNRSYSPEEL